MTASTNPKSESQSHEPLVDRALMGIDLAAEHHLANCPCCQGEREKTEQALRHYSAFQREEAGREDNFWNEQAHRIQVACHALRPRSNAAARLVPALALVMVLGLGLALWRQPSTARPTAQLQTVSDQDLLIAVESAVDTGTPYALEPVAVMVEEHEKASLMPRSKTLSNRKHKEPASHVQ